MPRIAAPAPAITGDVVKLSFRVQADLEECFFGLDYMSNMFSATLATDMNALMSVLTTAMGTHLTSCLSTDCTFQGILAIALSRNDVASQFSATGAGPGTIAGGHLPKEMSARFQKISTLKGAHGRGGMSVGPVPTTFTTPATSANTLNAAAILAYGQLLIDWAAPRSILVGSGATFTPCVSTRPPLGTSIVKNAMPIFKLTVDGNLGTVRRRAPGRGI